MCSAEEDSDREGKERDSQTSRQPVKQALEKTGRSGFTSVYLFIKTQILSEKCTPNMAWNSGNSKRPAEGHACIS